MTELDTINNNAGALIDQGGDLAMTAAKLADAHKIAAALCNTAMVGPHFKGKTDEAAAAIMYGDQIGMNALASLQNVFVISGRPGLYSRTMVGIVQAKGHTVRTVEESATSVTVAGVRKGSKHEEVVTWTIERAEKAGYTSNKKYKTEPQAMLYARAAGDVCRRIAPDALLGMAYAVEELEQDPDTRATSTVVNAKLDPAITGGKPTADTTDTLELLAETTTVEEMNVLWNGLDPQAQARVQGDFDAHSKKIGGQEG